MKHFLGSVGVRGSVRGPFFTRHPCQRINEWCQITKVGAPETNQPTNQPITKVGAPESNQDC